MEVPVVYLVLLVDLAFLFYWLKKDYAVMVISCLLLICIGIYIITNGLGVNDWLTQAFGSILIAIGGYVAIRFGLGIAVKELEKVK